MKKRLYLTPNSYVEDTTDYSPIIEVGDDSNDGSWAATYYNDLSGEVCLTDYDGETFFYRDDGGLKYQLQYLKQSLKETQKEAKILLKRKMRLYKKAIATLQKEYDKHNRKKKK